MIRYFVGFAFHFASRPVFSGFDNIDNLTAHPNNDTSSIYKTKLRMFRFLPLTHPPQLPPPTFSSRNNLVLNMGKKVVFAPAHI